MSALLFGVAPRDPATFAAAVGLALVLTFASSLVAALRALLITPKRETTKGLDNRLIESGDEVNCTGEEIACRERLGGMLRYYHRRAAPAFIEDSFFHRFNNVETETARSFSSARLFTPPNP